MTADQSHPDLDLTQEQEYRLDIEAILAEYHRRQMLEQLTGPLISLVFHIALIVGCLLLFTGKVAEELPEYEVKLVQMEIKPPLDPRIEKIYDDLANVPSDVLTPPSVNAPAPDASEPEGTITASIDGNVAATDEPTPGILDLIDITSKKMPLTIPAELLGRKGAAHGKPGSGGNHNGSSVTESAVLKALRWLKEHQSPDGSWSRTQPQAMAGLGLLTFLAHGDTQESPEFGATVTKAMQYLHCAMTASTDPRGLGGGGYVNGIATYALCEAYGMTQIPFLRSAMAKGLDAIIRGQQPCGGWDYNYSQTKRWDLSVTGWQLQALKAGYVAGAPVQGLVPALENGNRFIRKVTFADGKFGYSSPGSGGWGIQAAGTLCLQLVGEAECAEVKAGVTNLDENYRGLAWDSEVEISDASNPAYCWYYATQAMFHAGRTLRPAVYKKWNRVFVPLMVANQKADGHWDSPGRPAKGAAAKSEYDPYYTTCLNCLSLQVEWRYLPTYKPPVAVMAVAPSALDTAGGDLDLNL
ncbi:MAG: hypothetical protein A3K19_28085 [Lentisphaerae bacterium RIFOXYB12_FULL_65_16]|nr:MAG: hypothetical protein A3K18_27840 [Lentisphaerae bacterium RIFOXYA12_64_32]OGV88150.1 MAG: hypothetical protein A3K19_28085 [Lentisphaerae bacterium RIFOXYB12_FULL_65_16]